LGDGRFPTESKSIGHGCGHVDFDSQLPERGFIGIHAVYEQHRFLREPLTPLFEPGTERWVRRGKMRTHEKPMSWATFCGQDDKRYRDERNASEQKGQESQPEADTKPWGLS
jgi:hypothetical protein